MLKKSLFLWLLLLLIASPAQAVCPVCTVAVGAGIGLSRWLGIDDVITGLWIGGLTVSMIMWTINWLNKKKWHFKGREIYSILGYYVIIVLPLYFMKSVWHPLNTLWGINKLLLGIILGSVFFFAGAVYYNYLKKKNDGHAYFPFQKVAMPILPLIILSLIFYFITK
ncbi:MAG: hypothetical protein NTZ97_01490 [Candidatus Moranbacteria bacterium]|nr:hypothetical protein [Candidatus Moranbacteria bacterium]